MTTGMAHSYTYDAVNRLTQVSAGSITVSYTYDGNGNRSTMADPATTSYFYDSLDRLTNTTYPDGKSVQYAYDQAGNRISLSYPGGTASLTYAYDAANRLSQITQGTLQWTFAYDGAGNRTQLTQPNGTSTIYAYLSNNWLSSITHKAPGGAAFQTISYLLYDANGNRTRQADSSGTTNFSYDGLNRLIGAAYPGTYGTWSWEYDPVGNRASQSVNGGQSLSYTYDGDNRLTNAGAVSYTYDANGNLIGTSAGQSFSYDEFNRMVHAVGNTVGYTYNGDGLKVQRAGPDGTTRYYYDGFRPIWETDGAGAMTAQLDRDIFGNLLSRAEPTSRRYYHTDGLGSTVALTDEAGATAASMLYDAWGNVRVSTGTGHGKYRFTGAELDTTSNLYHMGARFYDPSIGRWLSEDPTGSFGPASLNFYAYVANNPIGVVDPAGTTSMSGDGGGGCYTATCDSRNENAYIASQTAHPTDSYLAWLGASQAGVTPPSGWEKYIDFVLVASRQTGVPASVILAIMAQETGWVGYNPSAVGSSGEIGLMQIMPSTAAMYGVTSAQLLDPATNISTGARYLADLLAQYKGQPDQLVMAISAYNQGPGNLARLGLQGNPGYWRSVLAYMEWFRKLYP